MRAKTDTVQALVERCRHVAKQLSAAHPTLLVIGNVVRRVLYFIRDEFARYMKSIGTQYSQPQAQQQIAPAKRSKSTQDDEDEDGEMSGSDDDESDDIAADTEAAVARRPSVAARDLLMDVSHQPNLASLLEMSGDVDLNRTPDSPHYDFKGNVIENINELIDELEDMHKNVAEHAPEHIHANEIILTLGKSKTVEAFLKASAEKKRDFDVIVTEHAPSYDGHEMVAVLSKAGINATLISDSAVFAVMSRVNKVVIGTRAVMADGGNIAPAGTHLAALAAKEHKVPVMCVTGLFKLTPLYPLDQDSFNVRQNPSDLMPFADLNQLQNVHVINPAFDYVPSNLIDLYITNVGTYNPTYIYRLLAEYYDTHDYVLE